MPKVHRKLLITDKNTFLKMNIPPIYLCDVGARTDIVEPWKRIETLAPNTLRVVGFEPDPEECSKLNASQGERRQYYNTALWRTAGEIEFNITRSPAQSSAFEPDIARLSRSFPAKRWHGRQVERKVPVQADTLDQVCAKEKFSIDFIKLDTQGAEYEILAGATETLKTCFGVQAECWHYAAYRGLRLVHDVMRLMEDNGFSTFVFAEHGSWAQGLDNIPRNNRSQAVTADALFLKNIDTFDMAGMAFERAVKWAAIAEIWGFAGYAMDLLRSWAAANAGAAEDVATLISRIDGNSRENFERLGASGGFPSLG